MKSFKKKLSLLSILCLYLISGSKAQVVINEYSCSNLTQFADNYGDYGDWFELYNSSGNTVALDNFYLSDDSLNNLKWQFPAGVTIGAYSFKRIWASGRDQVSGNNIHTNFKLTQTKNNSEFIVLSDPAGVIVDYVKLDHKTQLGHSRGRVFDGVPQYVIFTTPTPNASNNASTYFAGYADKPNASLGAGFYTGSISVSLVTNEPNANIYYTLDGTLPSAASTLYSNPLNISSTKVLKAITISADPLILPGFIEYETYFINVTSTLPVVSVSGNQLTNLANGSGTLEPKGTFEYFDTTGNRTAKTYGEFNRHGQDSWANSQRSIDFVSRDEMGYNHSLEEQFFPNSPRQNFQRVILRAAGDDNYPADHHPANIGSAHVRDAYIHNLSINSGLDLDVRRGIKSLVYLNGAYWGVYDIRENPDEHDFTDFYYGQDKYHLQYIETWGNTWAEYGGAQALTDWNNMYNYIMANNMNDPAVWQYVTDRYDGYSLVDYVLVNMFTVCSDWLNYNTGWWRGLDSTGTHLKWGYILWDNDATFGHYINYTNIPNTGPNALPCDVEGLNGSSDPKDHIGVLNKLRTNPDFNQYYISREVDLWNTVFSCDYMLQQLDSTVAVIDPEMTAHSVRWAGTYTEWLNNVQDLRNYILQRCNDISAGMITCYTLTGPYDVVFDADPAGAGSIKVNSLTHSQLPWNATYFGGITTKLEAIADSAHTFTNWSSQSQVFNPGPGVAVADINLNGVDSIVAHFTLVSTSLPESGNVGILPVVSVQPSLVNDHALVTFDLPEKATISLKLYNALGQEVMQLIKPNVVFGSGVYQVNLDFTGYSLAPGMYFLDFIADHNKQTVKLIYDPVR